ncbi:hypothetical protein [Parapedobacter sp. 2B3]|uniref:hypothetical protein n=1 Tax=Parapedobacter sp. 2B3 TaxID=3342381 RepID=UPI0035B66B8E
MAENLKAKAQRYKELYKDAQPGDVVEIGELKLKRTIIGNPANMMVMLSQDMLRALTINSMVAGLTPDEYVRMLISEDIKLHSS